jgi:hypothetical protein
VGNEKREKREKQKLRELREEKREGNIKISEIKKKKIRLCKIWGQKKKINKKNFFIKNRRQDMDRTGQVVIISPNFRNSENGVGQKLNKS